MFENKVIFITGGTGTWGKSITKKLLSDFNVKKIIIFSRSEEKQVMMEKEYDDNRLFFVLGDIRNKDLLIENTKGVDYIIHLAALKHIYKCEQNQSEATSINITGTQNIIDISFINNIKKVLYVSTDKAVEPYNLYGNTKAASEILIINANNDLRNKNTIFFILRAGNILGSNGSVLRVFNNQIINNKSITITDYSMKRFYFTIDEIIDLIILSFKNSKGGEIYVPRGVVLSLKDLLNIFLEIYGTGKEKINEIGIKGGEKKDEILISSNEVDNTFYINEKYFVINKLQKNNKSYKKVKFSCYSTITEYNGTYDNKKNKIIKNYIINLFGK